MGGLLVRSVKTYADDRSGVFWKCREVTGEQKLVAQVKFRGLGEKDKVDYGELTGRLEQFLDKLIEHRKLWVKSLDDYIPDEPIRNGPALEKQQRELSRDLAILNPYLTLLSAGRTRIHRATGAYWDIFQSAVGHETATIKGDSINDSILQLEGAIAVAQTHATDELVRLPVREEAPASQSTRASDVKLGDTFQISGGNVNIGAHGTINVSISIADLLQTVIAGIEKDSNDPVKARSLREKLKDLLDHPLGRLLSQITVGEFLKRV
jgi:hypothetical protein